MTSRETNNRITHTPLKCGHFILMTIWDVVQEHKSSKIKRRDYGGVSGQILRRVTPQIPNFSKQNQTTKRKKKKVAPLRCSATKATVKANQPAPHQH